MSCAESRGELSRAQLQWLTDSLPDLSFDPSVMASVLARPEVKAYLDYYHINFAEELGVQQGIGALDLAGFRIAVQFYMPQKPRGTLVIVHGYYDHTGVFGRAVRFGLEQNLTVLIFDLPGHGLSSGDRVAIKSFDEYADVLAGVIQKAQPFLPLPYYALGQSTGAATLLNFLWRYPRQTLMFKRIALCAPLLLPRGWAIGRIVYSLVRPFRSRVPRGYSRSSHDDEFLTFLNERDPLQEKSLSVAWVGAMKDWNRQFNRFTPRKTPLLILQGTDDLTVDWRHNLPVIQSKLPHAQIDYIQDAGHQLVNESDSYRIPLFEKISRYFSDDDL